MKLLADAVEGLKALARGEPPPPSKMQPPVQIDVPLTAFIPESYIGDLNVRLSLYQRMAAADAPRPGEQADAATDLERELGDRFGPPPGPVRNLLYIVRVRGLAKRAHIASISRDESAAGARVLSVRALDGYDFATTIATATRRQLEREDGVTIGHARLTIDLVLAGDGWRDTLVRVLEAAGAGT